MAISTYAELKSAVADYLDRTDLTAQIANFVALFEARINMRIKERRMVASTTLTPDASGEATLPSDFLEVVRVTYQGDFKRDLSYVTPARLTRLYPDDATGLPDVFTIEGGTLRTRPIGDADVALVYYQKVPALSDSATTNWLLTARPDIYLAGSMMEAYTLLQSWEQAEAWAAKELAATNELLRHESQMRGPVHIRPEGATP